MKQIFVGTSGWVYSHWDGIFYPNDLPSKDKLKYYSQRFKTTEVNYSFYHLPKPATYQNWYSQTPENFLFAVKASRFITHIKRLKEVKGPWRIFIKNALNLKEKLGPILFQFPPNFQATSENIKRLKEFLKFLRDPFPAKIHKGRASMDLRFAFEFRHQSWCKDKIYRVLRKYNAAWVIAGRSAKGGNRPKAEEITADFVYIRMHGSKVLFSSKYTKKELMDLAEKIKKWLKRKKDVFVYFNNDASGFSVENAKTLMGLSDTIQKGSIRLFKTNYLRYNLCCL